MLPARSKPCLRLDGVVDAALADAEEPRERRHAGRGMMARDSHRLMGVLDQHE